MTKTVPISVRISEEDAEFIAGLKVEGAVTPSEKIRGIIARTKKQKERIESFDGCLKIARDILKGVVQRVSELEMTSQEHSDLVTLFMDWVAESFAYVASSQRALKNETMTLVQLEEGIADRAFRLIQAVARMGVTAEAPCYDKEIITERFVPISPLTDLVNKRIKMETKDG